MVSHARFSEHLRAGLPRPVALAIGLGLLAGATTGSNLSLVTVLLLVVWLNVQLRPFTACWLAAFAAARICDGPCYAFGAWLLDRTPLGSVIAAFGDGPLVAMFDWDRYSLVGAVGFSLLLCVPVMHLAAKTKRLRRPRTLPLSEALVEAHAHWFRPRGHLLATIGLVIAMCLPWWIGPSLAKRELLRQFTEVNGAEASAGSIRLSLWSGQLVIDDLRAADPERSDRDRLRVGRLTAQLRPGALVRGRLHAEKISLEQVRSNVARWQDGDGDLPVVDIEFGGGDDVASAVDGRQVLDRHLRSWDLIRARLGRLQVLSACLEDLAAWEGEARDIEAGNRNVDNDRAARSTLGKSQPLIFVGRLRAEDLSREWGLGRKALVELTSLSSRPALTKEPTRLEIVAPDLAAEISVEFDLTQSDARYPVRVQSYDLPLSQLVAGNQCDPKIWCETGRINLSGSGWLDRQRLKLRLEAELDQLSLKVSGGPAVAGVEPATWEEALHRLGRLHVQLLVSGEWETASVSVNPADVVKQLRDQLAAAGELEVCAAVDEQLARPRTDPKATLAENEPRANADRESPRSPGAKAAGEDASRDELPREKMDEQLAKRAHDNQGKAPTPVQSAAGDATAERDEATSSRSYPVASDPLLDPARVDPSRQVVESASPRSSAAAYPATGYRESDDPDLEAIRRRATQRVAGGGAGISRNGNAEPPLGADYAISDEQRDGGGSMGTYRARSPADSVAPAPNRSAASGRWWDRRRDAPASSVADRPRGAREAASGEGSINLVTGQVESPAEYQQRFWDRPPADGETTYPADYDQPPVRESLLARWSQQMRNKFRAAFGKRQTQEDDPWESAGPMSGPRFGEPSVSAPDSIPEPDIEQEPDQTASRRWFPRLFR